MTQSSSRCKDVFALKILMPTSAPIFTMRVPVVVANLPSEYAEISSLRRSPSLLNDGVVLGYGEFNRVCFDHLSIPFIRGGLRYLNRIVALLAQVVNSRDLIAAACAVFAGLG